MVVVRKLTNVGVYLGVGYLVPQLDVFFSNIRSRETSQKNLGLEYLELMVAKT
jgi:hypothetical protein